MNKTVDNKKSSNIIKKGTSRVFRYNVGVDALVDGNTVQMAFCRKHKKKDENGNKIVETALEYIWHTKENGKIIKRGILVSGHGEYGVPTLEEYEVYVALQRIFINKKTKNKICELKTEELDEDYLTVEFTINELAREMNYSTPSSATRKKLQKSIDILLATTIFSIENGGIYDIRNKTYITNSKIGIHLLESLNSFDIINEDGNLNYTKIRISRFTYEQIINNYKLFYDKEIYNRTKNLIAKKIYHMALQWKGTRHYSFANINTIIERIPMLYTEDKYKKRDIKAAFKELEKKDMLRIVYDSESKDKVYFCFREDALEEDFRLEYTTYAETQERLISLGFDLIEIDKYLDIQKIKYIQALLRYIDTKTNIKNIKQYFIKCYQKNIKIPDFFYEDYHKKNGD